MKKLTYLLLTWMAVTSSFSVYAELYKSVDKDGEVTYSDVPPSEDAQKLETPQLNITPAVKVPPKAEEPDEDIEEEKDTRYSNLSITDPENDATIRNNEGSFSVTVNSQPELNTRQGHTFTLLLDGKSVHDKTQSGSFSLTNIDRGTHQIVAIIKNKQGKTLAKSKTTTVYIHRQSVLHKSPR